MLSTWFGTAKMGREYLLDGLSGVLLIVTDRFDVEPCPHRRAQGEYAENAAQIGDLAPAF